MGRKLHRYRKRGFRRQRPWLRTLLWGLACIAIVCAGFVGAKLLDQPPAQPETSAPVSRPDTPVDQNPDNTTQPSQPADTQPTDAPLRAIWLPTAALNGDALSDTLAQASKGGFNAVVFDLKDADGNLYYHFAAPSAQTVNSFAADAFTAERLEQLFATLQDAGFQPIPRLFAFRDNLGARALPAARIKLASNPDWTWLDNAKENGGKAWLNPYADEAHSYIISLAQELKEMGAAAILLDGVQFPHQISSASFGTSSNTNLSRSEVLTLFVEKVKKALGDDCPVMLGCTAMSALGNDTQVYGGNPLTFAPTVAAPLIDLSALPANIPIGESAIANTPTDPQQTVQALVAQMILRTKVMQEDSRPTVLPWLCTDKQSADALKGLLEGCITGGCEEFILYNPTGTYDFAALTLP